MGLRSILRNVVNSLEEAIGAQAERSAGEVVCGIQIAALFRCAADVVSESPSANLADQMEIASQKLIEMENNLSAQIYASGLAEFARVFREQNISLKDLVEYIRYFLHEPEGWAGPKPARSDETLKALVIALGRWKRQEKNHLVRTPDISTLFDLGII
mgnify:FL=1